MKLCLTWWRLLMKLLLIWLQFHHSHTGDPTNGNTKNEKERKNGRTTSDQKEEQKWMNIWICKNSALTSDTGCKTSQTHHHSGSVM